MESIRKGTGKVYFVADSAFYSLKNIGLLGYDTLWITHVPSTVGEAKNLLNRDLEMKTCTYDRYSIFEAMITYGGIDQKWIIVESKEMHARKAKSFDRRIEKEFDQARKSMKKIGQIFFACEADAMKATGRWLSENPHFMLKNVRISVISRHIGAKRGRPKKNESLELGYLIEADVDRNEEIIAGERSKLGRFVLGKQR